MTTSLSKKLVASLVCVGALLLPSVVSADVGVGVGSGKIDVQQQLMPGGIYHLPPVPVLNTGTVPSGYAMDIEYLQGQTEEQPPASWFAFSPKTFSLNPQGVQSVQVTLTVPVKAKPGNYFAYIEAHPVQANATGGITHINIAAAAKLYFTIAPANLLEGVYYRALSFITQYAPWTYLAFGLVALLIVVKLFRRFFSFNVGISVKKK